MTDAKLWIDEVGCTATITGVNVSYTMPLWAFEDMRDIIVAEAEKKVEVTHRDFDTQQELLDRYRAENAKLRELVKRMHRHIRQTCGECDGWYCSNFDEDNECCVYDTLVRELGIEVE